MRLLGQKIDLLQAIGAAHAPLATQFPERPLHQQEPLPDYTLKISNFTRKLAQAKSDDDDGGIDSEQSFTSHGYKMKLSVNLNEAPCGFAGYMGVYLGLMKMIEMEPYLGLLQSVAHLFLLISKMISVKDKTLRQF